MAQYDEERRIDILHNALESMNDILETIENNLEDVKPYAPDTVDSAEDKLEAAREKLESANEMYEKSVDKLANFKERAQIAAELYDNAQTNPDSKLMIEAEKARIAAEQSKITLESIINKTEIAIEKTRIAAERAQSQANIAAIKAKAKMDKDRDKKVRINFTLPGDMKDKWKDLADELSISVSQMVRNAMDIYEKSVKTMEDSGTLEKLKKIENFGESMDNFGERIGSYIEKNVQRKFDPQTGQPINIHVSDPVFKTSANKDKIKKRIQGLIKIQKCIPIEKLAQTIGKSNEEAENIIYELAAEGIEGNLEEGIFTFPEENTDEVINLLFKIIDNSK